VKTRSKGRECFETLAQIENAFFFVKFLPQVEKFLQETHHSLSDGLTELPDFSRYNIPKREKYTKLPQNIPNGYEIYKMAVKYTKCP
jgi:hypothetical protein